MTKPRTTLDYSKLKVTSNLDKGDKSKANEALAKRFVDCFGDQIRDWLTKLDDQQKNTKGD